MSYALGNEALEAAIDRDWQVPFYNKYLSPDWQPCNEVQTVIDAILKIGDPAYTHHRMIFFKWATWHQMKMCRQYRNDYVVPLDSTIYLLKKELRLLSSKAATILPKMLHPESLKNEKERFETAQKELVQRLRLVKQKRDRNDKKLKEMWDEEVFREEVYWALHRILNKDEEIVKD